MGGQLPVPKMLWVTPQTKWSPARDTPKPLTGGTKEEEGNIEVPQLVGTNLSWSQFTTTYRGPNKPPAIVTPHVQSCEREKSSPWLVHQCLLPTPAFLPRQYFLSLNYFHGCSLPSSSPWHLHMDAQHFHLSIPDIPWDLLASHDLQ